MSTRYGWQIITVDTLCVRHRECEMVCAWPTFVDRTINGLTTQIIQQMGLLVFLLLLFLLLVNYFVFFILHTEKKIARCVSTSSTIFTLPLDSYFRFFWPALDDALVIILLLSQKASVHSLFFFFLYYCCCCCSIISLCCSCCSQF